MRWRVHFDVAGAHVHCGVFCADQSTTFAKCGDLVIRRGEEFASFMRAFSGAEFFSSKHGITAACREASE